MPCTCVSPDDLGAPYDEFAAFMGECLFDPRERASYYVGLLSIFCWILCQVPQILLNARRGSASGLSLGLLAQWISGDLMNFVGSILTGQLMFQKASSLLFLLMDVVMVTQRAYYFRSDKLAERERAHMSMNTLNAPLLAASFLVFAPSGSEAAAALSALTLHLDLIPSCESVHVPSHMAHAIGQVLGWGAAAMYLGSRVPQILQNHRRKSVEGVSRFMFVAAICGNFTYGSGVLLRDSSWHAISKAFPWLVGSLGVMSLDMFIVAQGVWYSSNPALTDAQLELEHDDDGRHVVERA